MNWQIGDRAIIVKSKFPDRVGEVVTIMSGLMEVNPFTGTMWSKAAHFIDLPARLPERLGEPAAYSPAYLAPIPDNGSWSELEKTLKWNPMKLVVLESEHDANN